MFQISKFEGRIGRIMMSPTRSLVAVVTISTLFAIPVFSCLWPPDVQERVGIPIDLSEAKPAEYFGMLVNGHYKKNYWQSIFDELSKTKKSEMNRSVENRIAVALIHLGRIEEALAILEKLERTKPGSYDVAANLGTAYELMGDNDNAIKWISEGMKRNPESHFGTEWLHLKILRAKLAIKQDSIWSNNNSVLGIDWNLAGRDLSQVAVVDDQGLVHDAASVQKAIEYQLHERTEFVKPTDPTVASLLHDLSHLVRLSKSDEHGNMVFGGAQLYGYGKIDAQDLPPEPPVPPDRSKYVIIGAIASFILFILSGTLLARRKELRIK